MPSARPSSKPNASPAWSTRKSTAAGDKPNGTTRSARSGPDDHRKHDAPPGSLPGGCAKV